MKGKVTIKTSLATDPETLRRIGEMAEKQERSKSWIVRYAINRLYAELHPEQARVSITPAGRVALAAEAGVSAETVEEQAA